MAETKSKTASSAAAATAGIDGNADEGTHKLETPWSLYIGKKMAKGTDFNDFQKSLTKLGKFSTAEGFWRHYSYLQPPDLLPRDHDVFLFRNDLMPAWETFPQGGCWIIKVRKRNGTIGRLWEELVAALVGEEFREPDIVGVVLSTRVKEDLLSIWNRSNPDVIFAIGEKLKTILNLDDGVQPSYKFFKNAVADGSSFRHATTYAYAATGVPPPLGYGLPAPVEPSGTSIYNHAAAAPAPATTSNASTALGVAAGH